MPGRLIGRTRGSGPRGSRFESLPGSSAAAHGCGAAFVRRMARVGTGWRLQPSWPKGRGTRMRAWTVRVQVAPRARCRRTRLWPGPVRLEPRVGTGRRLLMTGCSDGRGDMTLNHGRTLVRLQPGQRNPNACLVITAARLLGTEVVGVQFSRQAPCGCGVVVTHHLATVKTQVRFPVSALIAL